MARVGGLERGVQRFHVADLADQDHVRVLPQHVPEGGAEESVSLPTSRWEMLRLHVAVQELDRVLDRDDVDPAVLVDVVDHRGERGRFARAGHAGHQHQPAGLERDLLEHLGQMQLPDRL